jgi:very-short-patch-repair endonuclease
MPKSQYEELFALHLRANGLPVPVREHRFHPVRKWRFDFAWPGRMIAVEVEGGTWTRGRHTRGAGYERDTEKYNTATEYGWKVYRFTSGQVERGEAIEHIERILRDSVDAND